jgi:hypothetical protein
VKAWTRALFFAAAAGSAGCGYSLANTPHDALGPFTVIAGEAKTPDAVALAAAIEGAQRELSRAGLLAARGEGTALTITVVRVEERSEGIASGTADAPLARGIRLIIAGRATARGADEASARDSGELEVAEVFARGDSAAAGVLGRDEAARRAGRRLGERLARRLLGEIDPGEP